MATTEVLVTNPSGLHARPAAQFVEAAARFESGVTVENLDRAGRPANAKSILSLLMAGVSSGHRIRITADGPDAEAAVAFLGDLVASGLGEAPRG